MAGAASGGPSIPVPRVLMPIPHGDGVILDWVLTGQPETSQLIGCVLVPLIVFRHMHTTQLCSRSV